MGSPLPQWVCLLDKCQESEFQICASGDWDEVRKLRKGLKHQQGRLKNRSGQLVSSEERAETLAEHLEKVQWAVRPTTAMLLSDRLDDELLVKTDQISLEEVFAAAKRLKTGRTPRWLGFNTS